ncbi:hypothetical protein HK098_002782 [Nowakowskiella sp. JEL0407]|nr:hypothetical protein HK098_002782 [Nowakowskiella sp. JEL0407]
MNESGSGKDSKLSPSDLRRIAKEKQSLAEKLLAEAAAEIAASDEMERTEWIAAEEHAAASLSRSESNQDKSRAKKKKKKSAIKSSGEAESGTNSDITGKDSNDVAGILTLDFNELANSFARTNLLDEEDSLNFKENKAGKKKGGKGKHTETVESDASKFDDGRRESKKFGGQNNAKVAADLHDTAPKSKQKNANLKKSDVSNENSKDKDASNTSQPSIVKDTQESRKDIDSETPNSTIADASTQGNKKVKKMKSKALKENSSSAAADSSSQSSFPLDTKPKQTAPKNSNKSRRKSKLDIKITKYGTEKIAAVIESEISTDNQRTPDILPPSDIPQTPKAPKSPAVAEQPSLSSDVDVNYQETADSEENLEVIQFDEFIKAEIHPDPVLPTQTPQKGKEPQKLESQAQSAFHTPQRSKKTEKNWEQYNIVVKDGPSKPYTPPPATPDQFSTPINKPSNSSGYGSVRILRNTDANRTPTKTPTRHPKSRDSPRPEYPKKQYFEEYMNPVEVSNGLRKGTLVMGTIRINRRVRTDAYVTIDPIPSKPPVSCITGQPINPSDDIYICGEKSRNRALEGDIVVIKLLDKQEVDKELEILNRKKKENRIVEKDRMDKVKMRKEHMDEESDEEADYEEEYDVKHEFGKVVSIKERKEFQRFVGTLLVEKPGRGRSANDYSENSRVFWFQPTDKRVPWITIAIEESPMDFQKDPKPFSTKLFLASITSWSAKSAYPIGKVIRVIGEMGNVEVETEAFLAENSITWTEVFKKEVLDCLPQVPWSIPESELKKRLDLRKTRIFSIDPPTARDLDDAVSCEVLDTERNILKIGVHIADVSYFVPMDSALDQEASNRATTVYLVQRAIPMLPRMLCEDLCSLNHGVDRLAFSVIFEIDGNTGELVPGTTPWFGRTIINNCAKLSYDHAQAIIDGKAQNSFDEVIGLPSVQIVNEVSFAEVKGDVLMLYELSKKMRKKRFADGALAIQSVKLWFKTEDEVPTGCGIYEMKESNRLIEEFMLLANMAVARKISSSFPTIAMLRSHAPPILRSIQQFLDVATQLGYPEIDASSARALQQSFENITSPEARKVLELIAVKPMKRARYVCAGRTSADTPIGWGYHHYALNVPLYTHFTSPIRRYCDLIVHRMLQAALDMDASPQPVEPKLPPSEVDSGAGYTIKDVAHIAKLCNDRKDSAKAAQDSSMKVYLCNFLSLLQARLDEDSEQAIIEERKYLQAQGIINREIPRQLQEKWEIRKSGSRGVLVEALVYNVSQRSFDVLVPVLGLEKRIWLEDLVDNKEIWGSKWNINTNTLVVYWKRREKWDFEGVEEDMEGEVVEKQEEGIVVETPVEVVEVSDAVVSTDEEIQLNEGDDEDSGADGADDIASKIEAAKEPILIVDEESSETNFIGYRVEELAESVNDQEADVEDNTTATQDIVDSEIEEVAVLEGGDQTNDEDIEADDAKLEQEFAALKIADPDPQEAAQSDNSAVMTRKIRLLHQNKLKLEPHEVRIQAIKVFKKVAIRIVPNVKRSPVDYKLLAEYPGFRGIAAKVVSFASVEGAMLKSDGDPNDGGMEDAVCIGVLDED